MSYKVNSTESYHRNEMETLGWELTVCNTIYNPSSPARRILISDKSYGQHLFSFLNEHIRISAVRSILEIGGGYGFLMRDLLACFTPLQVTMIDISPFLIGKQRETLSGVNVKYIVEDFLACDSSIIADHDLIIFNENLGDFPTVIDLDEYQLSHLVDDKIIMEIRRLCAAYNLEIQKGAINLGALLAVEKVCSLSIPCIFIAEHSCEAIVPQQFAPYADIVSTGVPHRIALKGHDEYTIKFSHLKQIALAHGYTVKRGAIADYLPFSFDDKVRFILSRQAKSDSDEIIQHFFSDLFQYEYLLLVKTGHLK